MPTPRLIATDMDGTLLFDWAQTLDEGTLALIRRCLDAGIAFMPASGRQYESLRKTFSSVADEIPYVADNGTLAVMGDEVVYRATMDEGLGDEIVDAIVRRPECEPLVSGLHSCYVPASAPAFYDHMVEVMHFEVAAVDDVRSAATGEPYSKISAHYAAADLDFGPWRERFGERCTVATSGLTWVDFMPLGVSKAPGIQAVCDRLGIAPRDCVAFGDAGNDIEMLDLVGCPIVVEGATAEARAHARHVVPSVEAALERILDGDGFDW